MHYKSPFRKTIDYKCISRFQFEFEFEFERGTLCAMSKIPRPPAGPRQICTLPGPRNKLLQDFCGYTACVCEAVVLRHLSQSQKTSSHQLCRRQTLTPRRHPLLQDPHHKTHHQFPGRWNHCCYSDEILQHRKRKCQPNPFDMDHGNGNAKPTSFPTRRFALNTPKNLLHPNRGTQT